MTAVLLEGAVSEGQFPTENVVTLTDYEGESVTLIASKSHVVERGRRHYLKVRLLGSENGYSVVLLPGEVFESGQTLAVRRSALVEY